MSVFREDPYPAFNFLVELSVLGGDGNTLLAGFSEVSGLEVEQEMIAYRNGNERRLSARLIPGMVRYAPLLLKRGVTGDAALWDWMKRCSQGEIERVDGRIILLNEQREQVMAWRIREALPSRLSGPVLNANRSEIAIESLELSHAGLELQD